ncbi:hypothetical protein SNEBB_007224, partial [Seison nebaliae]
MSKYNKIGSRNILSMKLLQGKDYAGILLPTLEILVVIEETANMLSNVSIIHRIKLLFWTIPININKSNHEKDLRNLRSTPMQFTATEEGIQLRTENKLSEEIEEVQIEMIPEIMEDFQEETEMVLERIEGTNEKDEENEENEGNEENEEHEIDKEDEEYKQQNDEAMDENEKGIEGSEVKRRETVQEMNEDKSENTIIDDLTPSTARKKQY